MGGAVDDEPVRATDSAFAQMLVARGFDAFLEDGYRAGRAQEGALAALMATAGLFVVSPDPIASTTCGWELEESTEVRQTDHSSRGAPHRG
jgi:hypothetical protein